MSCDANFSRANDWQNMVLGRSSYWWWTCLMCMLWDSLNNLLILIVFNKVAANV